MKKITYLNKKTGESITFGRCYPFVLKSIDANSLGATAIVSSAIGMDGQSTDSVTYDPRTIICELSYNGISGNSYDYQQMQLNWQKIVNVLSPKCNGVLTYQNDAGCYQINCRPVELPEPSNIIGTYCDFKMQFVADSPLWRSAETFGGPVRHVEDGLKYPLKYPIKYGTWQNDLYINNNTSNDLPIKIFGTIPKGVGFELKNISTGQKIITSNVFINSMQSDVYFELDTNTGRLKGGNIFKYNSDYNMYLKCGINHLVLTYSGDAVAVPQISIEYKLLFIGV